MMASFIDGRVRLRSPALRSEKVLEELKAGLSAYAGVHKMESNARTGSLLVFYDPAAISRERLDMALAWIERRFPVPTPRPGRGRPASHALAPRKLENRLLCGSALMTLAGAVSRVKSVHIAGGMFFFLLAGRHLYVRRNAL